MPVHLPVLPRRQATTLSQSELPWTYWICLHWPRLLRQDLDISYEVTMLDKRWLHFWVAVPGWIHAVVLNGFELRFCLCSPWFWWMDMRPSQLFWRLKDFSYTNIILSSSDHEFEWFFLYLLMFTFGCNCMNTRHQEHPRASFHITCTCNVQYVPTSCLTPQKPQQLAHTGMSFLPRRRFSGGTFLEMSWSWPWGPKLEH